VHSGNAPGGPAREGAWDVKENLGTVLEVVADVRRDRTAVIHGTRTSTWGELDSRAARLAGYLAGTGIGREARVGISLYNSIEYLEAVFAAFKLRAVPVNVNYRYRRAELEHLFTDSGMQALIYDAALEEEVRAAVPAAPALRTLVRVGDAPPPAAGSGTAVSYRDAVTAQPHPRGARGDDHWLMYTGGTTGAPKGVRARHSWLYRVVCSNGFALLGRPVPGDLAELRAALEQGLAGPPAMICLPAPPLMHATGMYTCLGALVAGGRVVFLPSRSYDPAGLAATIGQQRVDTLSIVGDVFARPLAAALDRAAAAGHPYDLSSLRRILSVGVTWSADVKQRLLAHADVLCRDVIAASEGGPYAICETRRGDGAVTSRFVLAPGARIIDEQGNELAPGSGTAGMLAAPADDEIGYAGDDAATARTFRVIGGRRWSVPGDLATLEADGTVVFQGRGSRVINTGGEKVFAEEVESAVLTHPAVRDALVVGVPDERWGSRIAVVAALRPGAVLDLAALQDHVGRALAGYKRPRELVIVAEVRRSPAGKADLRWAERVAREAAPAGGEPGVRGPAGRA
jgi:acyl-CoA synthetase (AMP-forming)/AMP-acid ligase II